MRIVVVCMANVCRSPMAQAVLQAMADARSLPQPLVVESAGVRVGKPMPRPDPRAAAALQQRGYPVPLGRSRPLAVADVERSDLLLAMDRDNLAAMRDLAPLDQQHKLRLFLDFAQELGVEEVPDPYYGASDGFERVLDLCEAGAAALLDRLEQRVPVV